MRVLVLTTTFPRWEGDVRPPFVFELSRRLHSLGSDTCVLAPHDAGAKKSEAMDGMDIYRFVYFKPEKYQRLVYGGGVLPNLKKSWLARMQLPILFILELANALILIKKKNIDIINAHWIYPQGLVGVISKKITGVPVVVIVHGTDVNVALNSRALRAVCSYVFRNADTITVNSRYIRNSVLAIDGSVEKKIELIPMGVDITQFKPPERETVRSKPVVFTVGRLIDQKGIDFLIRAMPEVVKKFPDVTLIIGGSGPEEGKLVALTQELSLDKNVIFAGYIRNAELPGYYSSADVFVLPSINVDGREEALGIVLLEAMACGTPVIGSDIGGIPDVIEDRHNGFLVPERSPGSLAGRIIELLSNRDLAEKFRANGLITVKNKYTWDVVSKKFAEINEGYCSRL